MHTSSQCLDDECIALWFSKRRTLGSPLPVVSAKQPYLFSNRQPFAWIGVRLDVQIANSACTTEDVSGQQCPHIHCEFGLTACTTGLLSMSRNWSEHAHPFASPVLERQ